MSIDLDLDTMHTARHSLHTPERMLWAAALGQLLRDAEIFRKGVYIEARERPKVQAAYYDLINCGAMTRKLCAMVELEPVYITQLYRRKVERLSKLAG